jgi:hypothetical protein
MESLLAAILLLPFTGGSVGAETNKFFVFFSPNGGCTDAIIREIDHARNHILARLGARQAMNFLFRCAASLLAGSAGEGSVA